MTHSFVRQSKYRHVFAKPMKRDQCLEDVRITKVSWDSTFACVNQKFIAVITEGSGGPFMVFPIGKHGRVDKDHPFVDAHRGPCLEVAWSPFNDNVIASCSEDATAKIWHIPEGGLVRTITEPLVELQGHQKRVNCILWHPSANNVLLTAGAKFYHSRSGDHRIFIWNVGTGEALIEIAGHPDQIWCVDFNYNGSKIVTTCKDKKIRVIDPRTGRILQQGQGHEGVKPQRAIFLQDGKILSTGFTRRSERMFALRDEEALEEPIVAEELDISNGVLFPFYDPDNGLLFLCGKGDCNIRYYEINQDPPFVHFINIHSSPEAQRGMDFLPKKGLDVTANEIARVYKCTNKGLVEVVQFFVPRKSDLFQEDLYPPTKAGKPAITADEWMDGKDADPILESIKPSGAQQMETASRPKANISAGASVLSQAQPARNGEVSATPPERAHRTPVQAKIEPVAPAPQPVREPVRDLAPPPRKSPGTSPGGSPSPAVSSHGDSQPSNRFSVSDFPADRPSAADRYRMPPPSPTVPPAAAVSGATVDKAVVDELLADVAKLKSVVKRHERRIRFLEELVRDKESSVLDNI